MFANRFSDNNHISKNPVFRWLAVGSGLNASGMQGEQVILGLLVYQLTGSSAWVGISLALSFAPMLFVGVPAGALADRFDRRTVMICTELALAALLGMFALLLSLGVIGLNAALLMSVLSGVLRSVHYPARLSFTGDIAGSGGMLVALSFMSIVTRLGQLLGALTAGVIGAHYGSEASYAALAIGHLLASGCFYRTRNNSHAANSTESHSKTAHPDSLRTAITEYLQLLLSSSTLILLIFFVSLVEVFGFSFATALPEIAVERLSLDAGGLGFMHAARSTGGLCGAIMLSALIVRQPGRLYVGVMMGFGLSLMLLAFAPGVATVLICIALIAVFASATDVLAQSMLQLCVPDAMRGRAMGAWVVALGMGPIGHLELGLLISLMGTTAALLTNGIVLVAMGLAALFCSKAILAIRNPG